MIEAIDANGSFKNPDVSNLPEIVGTLYLENHYYPIAIRRNNPENSEIFTPLRELSNFEIDGQFYTVLTSDPPITKMELGPQELLTPRELEIAMLVALGQPNKQIAKQLNISKWTVSTHLRRIFAKLGVGSRAAMIYLCSSLLHQNLGDRFWLPTSFT